MSAHTDAILVGFVMLMILGAALWLRSMIIAAGLLQIAGLALFCYTMWSRIRPSGSRVREKAGERF